MRNEKIRISLINNSAISLLLQALIINGLLLWIFYEVLMSKIPKIGLFSLSFFLIIEIFIKFSLEKVTPTEEVSKNSGDLLNSFTKKALETVLFKKDNSAFLNYLLKFPESKFFLQKAVITQDEINDSNLSHDDVSRKAFEIAKKLNGKFVTISDLITSYLLLSEPKTKLLFNKKLKEEDLLNINNWTRVCLDEENPKKLKARFVGIGLGEALVWGWTYETKKYTKDLTFSSIKIKALIEGREKEYASLIDSLQKPENNNILLIGEIGTGKTNLVENLIFESYDSLLPNKLNHRRFLELMVGPFVAGAANREDLETRLQAIIEEIKHSGNVILYIPEFQNLIGSTSYNIDLSGAILPYLKDGKIPIIATMSPGQYKKYFEKNALREVFNVIMLEEPDVNVALKMLFQKTDEIEKENKIVISYKAVLAGVRYADKYDVNSLLPGTAVELLSDTANSVAASHRKDPVVLEEDVLQKIEQKSHIPVGSPKQDEKILLLNLEGEMHRFVIGQEEAIKSIAEAMRRVRAGLSREKPISFLFLGPTGVGKTETAKSLAKLYFGGEEKIIRLDMSEYATEESLQRILSTDAQSFLSQISNHPFSLVLLDEFEKANQKILNLFLQVLDDGRITDLSGRTISFSNAIIISTSNAGSEFIRENLANENKITNKELLDYLQKKVIFSPELLNRFDEIVMFKPLSEVEVVQVVKLLVSEFSTRISAQDITVVFDKLALEVIAKSGYDNQFGARPLRRFIQDNIEDVIAKKILSGEISRGDKVKISADTTGKLSILKT